MKPNAALDLFTERMPRKPYCSDDLDMGLVIRGKNTALRKPYIQHNPPDQIQAFVHDMDRPVAVHAHVFADIAPPNFVVVNPENSHGHLVYVLETPVCRTSAARLKPLRYAAAIESEYRSVLAADPGYPGMISKNPLHDRWCTVCLRSAPYDLAELAEWISLDSQNVNRPPVIREDVAGLGRNCEIFERLRTWAYNKVRYFWKPGGYEQFSEAVLNSANALNNFSPPLPSSEIKGIAKSVASWVWARFTPQDFRDIQIARSQRAAVKRREKAAERAERARDLKAQGLPESRIADIMGLHRSTIYRLLHCR